IGWIDQQKALAPGKPFFVYYATGSAHTPHQAPPEWLDRFKGQFDAGWDAIRQQTFDRQVKAGIIPSTAKLTPRPAAIPAWSALSADQRRMSARLMEAYAASLAFGDAQIGRVVQHLKDTGQFQNTLIIFIEGDNGPSAEGGLNGLLFEQSAITRMEEDQAYALSRIADVGSKKLYNHYSAGWAFATATPFQWMKQVASHFGGTRNALAISWPARIKETGLRQQFHFVTDLFPTILDAAGIEAPASLNGVSQMPVDGISMLYSMDKRLAPPRRSTQVFELMENLGIYHDGWFANTTPVNAPWEWTKGRQVPVRERVWELYDLTKDFTQSQNVAAQNPAELAEMEALFWAQAGATHILPHPITIGRAGRPDMNAGRSEFVYPGNARYVPETAAPPIVGKSFSVSADITVGEDGGDGVIVAFGGRFGGYALYMKSGVPTFTYNALDPRRYVISSSTKLVAGKHRVEYVFYIDPKPNQPIMGQSGGTGRILVDGRQVGQGRIEHTLANWISHTETLDVGLDTVTPVSDDYSNPTGTFSGSIAEVRFKIR
ncbi:MAG: sulfatase-like hydrolase/transferase, partial [Sphingorhabdus sp.]|uniref:sulfatase-like hydrolase/transferase n=1 Tax=Sphingorhabdus sp. TaxID=1902408 RepID=UPI003C8DD3FB